MDHKPLPYTILGVMSGTSLDGLDLALCRFSKTTPEWEYEISSCREISYDQQWKNRLGRAHECPDEELMGLDRAYGRWIGRKALDFIKDAGTRPDFIASHGHTVFHQPGNGVSRQIGSGDEIARITGLPAITDFRSADVALGGQGAPLVPLGDELLFGAYTWCLNLGGICNISWSDQGTRRACDVAPCNMVLNHLSAQAGVEMDESGAIGRSGELVPGLLEELDALAYYQLSGPKSLGREWFESAFLPVIRAWNLPVEDSIRTCMEHISRQTGRYLKGKAHETILLTGGGTRNTYLVELIGNQTDCQLIIPPDELVSFKESLVFAFLGLLRYLGLNNCLASVTGASRNSMGGRISYPPPAAQSNKK